METYPTNPESARPSRPYRRLFRWGIVFWILAWIVTVCNFQVFYLNVKGCMGVVLGTAAGSIHCEVNHHIAISTKFGVRDFGFLWSNGVMDQVRQGPGIMTILARGGWRKRAGTTDVSFPIAGFLWLWLAAGWAAEIRYRRFAIVKVDGKPMVTPYSRRRLIVLTVALTLLGITTSYLAMRSQQATDKAVCFLQIRNIQQAIRSWSGVNSVVAGKPIVWSYITGVHGYFRPETLKCPSGCDYQLSPLVPPMGELAARCPHPEHQRFIDSQDTSGW